MLCIRMTAPATSPLITASVRTAAFGVRHWFFPLLPRISSSRASSSPSQTSSTLGVAWLDTRNSPASKPNTLYDAYGIVSTDGGSTWNLFTDSRRKAVVPRVERNDIARYSWRLELDGAWENGIFHYAFPSTANGSHQVAMIAGLNP